MGIRPHHRIRVGLAIGAKYHRRQILQVHLVDDAGIGRHHAEVLECRLPPAQQHVAFAIASELQRSVEVEGVHRAEVVHLYGVVDHQVGGQQRVGAVRVGTHGGQRVAHGGQVDNTRYAGEILQQHARRHEADLFAVGALSARHRLHILRRNATAIFVAQQVLQQDLDGKRKASHASQALLFERGQPVIFILAVAGAQLRRRTKTIFSH